MANPFDQFDPPTVAPPANPFDQFDEKPKKRSDFTRFLDDATNAFLRGPLVSSVRDSLVNPDSLTSDMRGSMTAGLGSLYSGVQALGRDFPGLGRRVAQWERDRRARFDAASKADPWNQAGDSKMDKAVHGAAALSGTIIGTVADPTNLVAPGRSALARIASQGAVNAANNASSQQSDVDAGLQKSVDWTNIAEAGAVGATFGTLGEVVRPLASWVHSAFTDAPSGPRSAPPPPPPGGGRSGRFRTAEDYQAEFEARQQAEAAARAKAQAQGAAREPGPAQPEGHGPASRVPVAPDAEGRFRTTRGGYVQSDTGGPVIFDDQKAAARWIIDQGHTSSPDQVFSVANHPEASSGNGRSSQGLYTVQETGRTSAADAARGPKTYAPEGDSANAPPATTGEAAGASQAAGGAPPPEPPPNASSTPPGPPEPHAFVKAAEKKGLLAGIKRNIDEKGLPLAISEALGRAYTATFNYRHPIVRAVEMLRSGKPLKGGQREPGIEDLTRKPKDIPAGQDPRKLASVGQDVYNIGHADVVGGIRAYHSNEVVAPSMADILVALTARDVRGGLGPHDVLAHFDSYLIDRRGLDEWDRYDKGELDKEPLPVDKGGDRASLEAHGAALEEHFPYFAELADKVNEVGFAIWRKLYDAGMIDQATFDGANANRQFWVPFKRDMGQGEPVGGGGADNAGKMGKKFRGSQKDVLGPVDTLVKHIYQVNARIRQNDINLGLVTLAEELDKLLPEGMANPLLRKVKVPMDVTNVSPEELIRAGLDGDLEAGAKFYRPGDLNPAGRPIIHVWRNGKPEAWEIIDRDIATDLFNALTGMGKDQGDLLLSFLRSPASWLRKGVTVTPPFAIANFAKDQLTTAMVTPGYAPFAQGLYGGMLELRQGKTTGDYLAAGGVAPGASAASLREYLAKNDVMALRARGLPARYSPINGEGVNLFNLFNLPEIAEIGTRLGVFKMVYTRAIHEGSSDWDATIEAAHSSRDPLDFGRFGSRMLAATRIVPFLRAGMNGLDKYVRASLGEPLDVIGRQGLMDALHPLLNKGEAGPLRQEDAAKMVRAYNLWAYVAGLTALSIGLTAIYHDDPEWQSIPQYIKASNWLWRDGSGTWHAAPKPFEAAAIMNVGEEVYRGTVGEDSEAWGRMARDIAQNLALPYDNPLTQTAIEEAANKKFYTGGSIVPDSKMDMLPQDQATSYTSELARALGGATGIAPARIDHIAGGLGGTMGQMLMRYSNWTNPNRPEMEWPDATMMRRFFPAWQRGSQDISDYYDRVGSRTSELQQRLNSITERLKADQPGEAMGLIAQADEPGKLWLMTQLAGRQAENGDLSRNTGVPKLHPLSRASAVVINTTRMLNEIYGDTPHDQKGAAPDDRLWRPDRMTPGQKTQAHNLIEQYVVSEVHNAMVATGQPGFEHRKMMSRDHYIAQLNALDPKIIQEVDRRLSQGRDKAYSYNAVMSNWPKVTARLRHDGLSADLSDLAADASVQ